MLPISAEQSVMSPAGWFHSCCRLHRLTETRIYVGAYYSWDTGDVCGRVVNAQRAHSEGLLPTDIHELQSEWRSPSRWMSAGGWIGNSIDEYYRRTISDAAARREKLALYRQRVHSLFASFKAMYIYTHRTTRGEWAQVARAFCLRNEDWAVIFSPENE